MLNTIIVKLINLLYKIPSRNLKESKQCMSQVLH